MLSIGCEGHDDLRRCGKAGGRGCCSSAYQLAVQASRPQMRPRAVAELGGAGWTSRAGHLQRFIHGAARQGPACQALRACPTKPARRTRLPRQPRHIHPSFHCSCRKRPVSARRTVDDDTSTPETSPRWFTTPRPPAPARNDETPRAAQRRAVVDRRSRTGSR